MEVCAPVLVSAPDLAVQIAMAASTSPKADNNEQEQPLKESEVETAGDEKRPSSDTCDPSIVDISHILENGGKKKKVPACKWIETLKLEPYPLMSDCYHKETFRDSSQIQVNATDGSPLTRPLTTLNYFLHLPTMPFSKSLLIPYAIRTVYCDNKVG